MRGNHQSGDTPVLALTKKAIEDVPLPAGKMQRYRLPGPKGFELRVYPSGRKAFYVHCRSRKLRKVIDYKIGDFSSRLLPKDAADAAERAVGNLADGKDPNEELREQRAEPTFQEAFRIYQEQHVRGHCRERTHSWYDYMFRQYLGGLAKKRLSEFDRAAIHRLHADMAATPYAANRCIKLIKAVFNYAIAIELCSSANPAVRVTPYKEENAGRRMTDEDIRAFVGVCRDEIKSSGKDNTAAIKKATATYALLSLYIGRRRSEMLSMCWADIDLKQRIWRLPRTKTTTRSTLVYLCEQAVELLKERRTATEEMDSPFVFPARTEQARANKTTGYMRDPHNGFGNLQAAAKIRQAYRIHDLKHTFVSLAAETVSNAACLAELGGHKLPGMTARYAHPSPEELRRAYQATANHLDHIVAAAQKAKVVLLRHPEVGVG